MKKVLYLTNFPSPYRVQYFDELADYVDVTVLFTGTTETKLQREAQWYVEGTGKFHRVRLKKTLGAGETDLCLEVISWLKKQWDAIVVCGYSTPTAMLAIFWMKLHRIPFWMEVDGGLIRESSGVRYQYKKLLISAAQYWLGTGNGTTEYLVHYGAKRERVFVYPFTSLYERDILPRVMSLQEKKTLRAALGMKEEKILVYVGRFTREKGMDDLLQAAVELEPGIGVYFIGGEGSQAHLDFCRERDLKHVHFVGFKQKDALLEYYKAADAMVLPTHSDVWGLVVNEAMANGLPVITTDQCVAGMELIEDGVNGYIVPVQDHARLVEKIHALLSGDYAAMGAAALETIRPYTLENMAKVHADIFENRR